MEFKFWRRREPCVNSEKLLERVTFNPEIFGGSGSMKRATLPGD